MVDLSTRYLGLPLRNPLVVSASPMTRSLDKAKSLEDAGAGAIVMHSLFEEELLVARRLNTPSPVGSETTASSRRFDFVEKHLEDASRLCDAISIPVIGSINGTTCSDWLTSAQALAQAGVNAIELNIYHIPVDVDETSNDVEQRYYKILRSVIRQVDIPVTLKLSPYLSAPISFIRHLERIGAKGVSVFDRFFQPDIDIHSLQPSQKVSLSNPDEALSRIRWLALLRPHISISLAATGGFHRAEEIIKALLAGADVVQMCSVLLTAGPSYLGVILEELEHWCLEHEYSSLSSFRSSLAVSSFLAGEQYARSSYVNLLDRYHNEEFE